jgi:predicted nucleic acid-binding protein
VDRLLERLKKHTTVGLDTCIFIYHFEANPDYVTLTRAVLNGIQEGRWKGIISAITFMELAVKPLQLGLPAMAQEYEMLLVNFPHLSVAEVTREIARRAARLRAEYRIKPADALQLATSMVCGATALVSNDKILSRLSPGIDVLLLDEFRNA